MAAPMVARLLLAALVPQVLSLDNGVALTPPRGFSTWVRVHRCCCSRRRRCRRCCCSILTASGLWLPQNAFPVHSIDEATCYKYLDALVKHGLHKLNYTYFVVDEPCFAGRTADGTLIENKTTWPNGLKKFGEALRSHGMKLGTYTCVGPKTCGGCIASEGHEDQDVATFAEWGVEYLKVDSCSRNCTAAAGVPNATQCGETLWSRYTTAIAKHKTVANEQMVYSIVCNCDPGRGDQPWKWAKDIANSWRTNIDIQNGFGAISYVLDAQRRMSGNGSWCPTDPTKPDGKGSPCADGKDNGACPTCAGPESFSGIGHWVSRWRSAAQLPPSLRLLPRTYALRLACLH
jgi:alpha-galactosidase